MKRNLLQAAAGLLALACLALIAVPAAAQDKPVDMKKLIAEIIGDYDFPIQGQSMIIQFTESEGKLYGAPVNEPPEELKPVEGKPLCFDVTVSESGEYFVLQFVRNDKGVIDKCVMSAMGQTIEGTKIVK